MFEVYHIFLIFISSMKSQTFAKDKKIDIFPKPDCQ
jgi:hypothetical protein